MRLRLCGTRGSTPAPGVDFARYGGQTSCVAVISDDGQCRLILDAGARTSRSSVHLHATFDTDDKASGALRFLARELGQEPGAALSRFAFVGDSGNDAACFAAFRTTFGVANVAAAVGRLSVPPRYVARAPMGEGFAEIAGTILRARARV